ncbi:MAG: hypothetical protein QXE96_07490 [Candidatus Caldarchaeum sp.]
METHNPAVVGFYENLVASEVRRLEKLWKLFNRYLASVPFHDQPKVEVWQKA